MTGGLIALVVALALATAVGLVMRRRSGRFRVVSASGTVGKPTGPGGSPSAGTPAAPVQAVAPLPAASVSAAPMPAAPLPAVASREALTEADLGAELGERATLVQFSTAFCAPCRPTRQILAQVADMVDGVVHVDIDATTRLDLVRRLHINSTPTVLVLGPDGTIARRASGRPRKADVLAALGQAIGPDPFRPGPGSDSRSESE